LTDELLGPVLRKIQAEDREVIVRAYQFAKKAHEGQTRDSGEEFIVHPLAVATILADMDMDAATVAAGLLHDVAEDTDRSISAIEQDFGREIAFLVDGVTKLSRLEFRSREEEQVENLRKMFLAMARDIRVIIIKLADRLHNMRTLKHIPPQRQMLFAEETMEIFAPLAHRLGIWTFKWELEDLAFRYMHPDAYAEVADKVAKQRKEREEFTSGVIQVIREKLLQAGIRGDIQGRAKHLYSIYKKMTEGGKGFSDIYDLIAVRVVVDTVKDCYAVLGIVHTLYKPIPGRFKDYIAMPKSNMYQSLHTTVMGPEGEPFEIQIRTWDMHRTAEYGIAAHWRYKEGTKGDRDFEQKLSWFRQVLEWQQEMKDAREFMESLKIDLFDDEVFVFTPNGDVIDLPAGATPVDFAYRIHTEVGNKCVGAKVNGKIVPLSYVLKNGDKVEILTSKQSMGPSWDWLSFVKTSSAKSRIRQWFKKERREENLQRGKELIEKECKRLGFETHQLACEEYLEHVSARMNFMSVEDLLAAVGYGGVSAQQVVSKLKEEWKKEHKGEVLVVPEVVKPRATPKTAGDAVQVRGTSNVLVRFSRCCNPVPGDPIIGYITRGRGVSVHRIDCPNIKAEDEHHRLIEVTWADGQEAYYPVEIEVSAVDRPGLLSEVATIMAEMKTNIISAKAKTKKNSDALIDLVIEIKDLEELNRITKQISRIRDVVAVRRVTKEQ